MQMQEEEVKEGKQELTTLIYSGAMKAHSNLDEGAHERDEKVEEMMDTSMYANETCLSSQMLYEDEQDIEMPDEKLDSQLELTKGIIDKLVEVLHLVAPVCHDLKEGNLKRVAKSTYVQAKDEDHYAKTSNSESSEIVNSLITLKSKQQRQVDQAIESARSARKDRLEHSHSVILQKERHVPNVANAEGDLIQLRHDKNGMTTFHN